MSQEQDLSAVQPLPFVLVDDDGGFRVNPEACAVLEKVKTRLVVVAVVGLYRTGKSFLLNLLVRHAQGQRSSSSSSSINSAGFAVGGTVNACTKGIWMWGQPVPLDDDTSVLFLDTEGLGSVDREQTHDTRIFALALLLASSFVYNSRGVIDGNAIEDLSLVVNLSKHIQTSSASSSSKDAADRLHEFFPSFLWVVRDFTLQLLDNGKPISSKQYLENALQPTGGYSDDAVEKDQIRALLSDFFRQRDCVTLVRPVDDEQKLRNLPKVPYEELRDEFRSSFESLRKRLFGKAKPKTMFGKPLNGAMFVNLASSYVEALNSGKAPVISSAWSRVVQAQCHDALEDAVERYKAELHARVRSYVSPEQYEADAGFEVVGEEDDELEVVDNGQGANAMFDEHGNLRSVALRPELEMQDSIDEGEDPTAPENEMIEIMEKEADAEGTSVERTRLPCAEDRLKKLHRLCKRLAKKKLCEIVDGDMGADAEAGGGDDYMAQFRAAVTAEFDSYRQQNAAASMAYCRHVLDVSSHPGTEYLAHPEQHRQKSAMELFRETQNFLQDDLSTLHKEYFARAVGPSADAAYCEFISQRVLSQVIQRTENTNAAHMSEVRGLEKLMNDLSVKVAVAQGQAGAMQELSAQQQQKCELGVKEAEQRCAAELAGLRSALEFKTNELEHILNHNATMKRLADTAQQGQYRATEFASSAFAQILCGYLIKQHMAPGAGGSARAKWQQRYFVLQGPQLSFYDTKEDYERCRSDNPPMDVTGAIIEDNYAVPEAFSVSFRDDKYYPLQLHAKSREVKDEWVRSLRAAAAGRGGARGHASSSSSLGSSANMNGDTGASAAYRGGREAPPSYADSGSSAYQSGGAAGYAYQNSSSNLYGPTGGNGGSRYMQM
ncbi:hypothetical protein PF011_g9409 [Phytophthora fragariae]|uniref:GB1/RHD3-type G domain-containing protein n=1 Tax=Phytophthora fragariae TaxID=53985 RepID=A0A6A3L033_9STRA|nr:hypothetical protein PF011_g9409 [Phytophthora fragariae]